MLYVGLGVLLIMFMVVLSEPKQIEEPHHDSMPYSHYSISHRKEKN